MLRAEADGRDKYSDAALRFRLIARRDRDIELYHLGHSVGVYVVDAYPHPVETLRVYPRPRFSRLVLSLLHPFRDLHERAANEFLELDNGLILLG